ncbi:MAG: hypothetical protein ACRC20_07060 [Segniliparus sp.]|uniref:phosphorylase family protein n=1 Tax=Segniliparus sp. TaxID=2804064 RepID=UPI003F363FB4
MRVLSVCLALLAVVAAGCSKSEPAGKPPISVKVFVGAMFEKGKNTGDAPGEFQLWYEKYFSHAAPVEVRGAANPVYCTDSGICGAVLGMGKVGSTASMQAILLNPAFDFDKAYYLFTGVAGTPPERGSIGDASWGSWLVDFDLGHKWGDKDGAPGDGGFRARAEYDDFARIRLDPKLVAAAVRLTERLPLRDSPQTQAYRDRFPYPAARRPPKVVVGSHLTGDTYFVGAELSEQAQFIAKHYGADDYVMTEMENLALARTVGRTHGTGRVLSLRGAVDYDHAPPGEAPLSVLTPVPGVTFAGFDEAVENLLLVGSAVVDDVVARWGQWQNGPPA